jgi:shikimate dehydrogenase
VRDLKENLRLKLQGQRILILGAGGATRGVLAPLLAESPGELVIANRTADRAHKLAQEFGDLGMVRSFGFDLLPDVPYDLVINATSASLGGEVPAVSAGIVTPASACYDMAYGRSDTPFVAWARAQGCRVAVDGLGMLVEQAAESFQLWRNVRPETRGVLEAVRNRATAW